MIFISIDDFYEKVNHCKVLGRQEEIECACQMKNGDVLARERLIESYFPVVAAHIKRTAPHIQSLGLVCYCWQALEKAVDSFDFLQESATFVHHLSWHLRQAVTKYIVDSR